MKFILINVQDIKNTCELKRYYIDDTYCINELVLQENKLRKILNESSKLFHNLKLRRYEANIKRQLNKALDISELQREKWCYMFPASILNKLQIFQYIAGVLNKWGGLKYIPISEMNSNIKKYIEEYAKQKKLNLYELKTLFVYKDIRNINFDVIEQCIKEYKKVNIYLLEKPNSAVLSKIAKINSEQGTSIEIIKYNKKAFLEYDVIYFADDFRTNHPRMRMTKATLVVDEQDSRCDRYNSNILFFNTIKKKIENVSILSEQYGVLNVATAVRKIVN